MTDFTYDVDADGVATITWDVPGKVDERDEPRGWDELRRSDRPRAGRSAVKGVVITSGKDSFAGGMDLNVIAR
jgi:3-hydroxyacyl-CoA dehydrogenase / enoyl-CoA hydratase / 3-hydroxybutyryl-CoA epimerase